MGCRSGRRSCRSRSPAAPAEGRPLGRSRNRPESAGAAAVDRPLTDVHGVALTSPVPPLALVFGQSCKTPPWTNLRALDSNPRPSGYESLQGCWVPADLQGFREIGCGCVRSNLLVLVPVWYPFWRLAACPRVRAGGDSSAALIALASMRWTGRRLAGARLRRAHGPRLVSVPAGTAGDHRGELLATGWHAVSGASARRHRSSSS